MSDVTPSNSIDCHYPNEKASSGSSLENGDHCDDLMLMGTPKLAQAPGVAEAVVSDRVTDLLTMTPPVSNAENIPKGEIHATHSDVVSEPAAAHINGQDEGRHTEAELATLRRRLQLDYDSRLLLKERELTQQLERKESECQQLRDSHSQMQNVVADFERTLGEVLAEREETTGQGENEVERLQGDNTSLVRQRDQALEDVRSVEAAFSDLHKRYEKSKESISGYQKNEQSLKACAEELKDNLFEEQQRYIELKQHAEAKIQLANEEIKRVRASTQLEVTRLQAGFRRAEVEVESLRATVDQKTRANEELGAICDELLSKVGSAT